MVDFFRNPFFLPWLYPQLTWRIKTDAKELYLTFDDGPVPGPTEFVLGQLAKFNAPSTFFCIGDNIAKYPDVFRRMFAGGHAIGNHTFNHLSGWSTSTPDYLDNITQCQDQIDGLAVMGTSGAPKLFRPPYGRITRNQIKALGQHNIVMWDVLTHDYARSLSAERCLRGSIAATRTGSIIVFHDSFKAEKNMEYVLPRFLDHFASLGYSFKSLR